jgi:hypothetical protein
MASAQTALKNTSATRITLGDFMWVSGIVLLRLLLFSTNTAFASRTYTVNGNYNFTVELVEGEPAIRLLSREAQPLFGLALFDVLEVDALGQPLNEHALNFSDSTQSFSWEDGKRAKKLECCRTSRSLARVSHSFDEHVWLLLYQDFLLEIGCNSAKMCRFKRRVRRLCCVWRCKLDHHRAVDTDERKLGSAFRERQHLACLPWPSKLPTSRAHGRFVTQCPFDFSCAALCRRVRRSALLFC